jgi:aminoacylase
VRTPCAHAAPACSALTRRRGHSHDPFAADIDERGRIFARGSQDMKCVGLQYLEAIRRLKAKVEACTQCGVEVVLSACFPQGFAPLRTVLVTFVPDEEIGGNDGMGGFVSSARFAALNVGLELDEGWATPGEVFPVFYAERCPWWFTIRAEGEPGHGSKLYDGGAMERLQAALARIFQFRAQQFDKIKVRAADACALMFES